MPDQRMCLCPLCSGLDSRPDRPFISSSTLAYHCPLDNPSRTFTFPAKGPGSVSWPLRGLQSLPLELYHACLQYLDVRTIVALRTVSQYTRHVVSSFHQYKELYEHAPHALRACLATGASISIPIWRLHHSLTSIQCYYCQASNNPENNFGAYLSLFEGRRTCLFCLRNNPSLRPVELMTLINLCFQRSSTIDITKTPRIHTLAGFYPGFKAFPSIQRAKLVASCNVRAHPGKTITERESSTIFGNTRSAIIYHHPFLAPEDESDIAPSQDYVSPDSPKQITYRYASAISFPYLVPNRENIDMGVLCKDCVLSMLYREQDWKVTQEEQSIGRHRPRPSMRRLGLINEARKLACRQYIKCKDALGDEQVGLSIQEHRLVHTSEKWSKGEEEWRESFSIAKLPADSLLRLQQYG